jgi:hypothetical protein
MKNRQKKSAFSLFELSIIILVISFLVVGAMKGGELVRKSKVTAAAAMTKSSMVKQTDGLVLWLETTMPNSFNDYETADNVKISTWYNISDTKITPFNATQSTTSLQPTYTTAAINGLPAIKFTAANSNCIYVASGFDDYEENATVFLVFQPTAAAGTEMNLLEKWNVYTPYPFVLRTVTGFYISTYDGSVLAHNPSASSTTQRVANATYLISARKIKNGTMQIWINGTQEGSATDNTTGTTTNNVKLAIGCRNLIDVGGGSNINFADGYYGEIIIYNRALSDQEKSNIESYLGKKWSITIP